MAQFDVHRNPGRHRDDIPYVVLVQSAAFDDYARRVVVPLVRKAALGKVTNVRFNPGFRIEGIAVVQHPLEIVSVATRQLGDYVTSLRNDGNRITDALDELLTQVWG